jgi:3-oxoadipate enol-lactonase
VSIDLYHRFEGREHLPVLVLSNSLGTALEMWDDQAGPLAEHFRLLRFDSRGHGRSAVPRGPYSIDELGRDALELLDRLGLERVSFCGLSMGGMTALWLAIHAPERIDRLALCSTSAHMPPRSAWIERAEAVRAEGMEAVADASIERWFSEEGRTERPEAVERVRQDLLATPAEGYAASCEAIADHDLRAGLGRIRAPTLVIVGDEDPSAPPPQAQVIADGVEDARLVEIERARHLLNVEHPDRVTELLIDHLTGGEPPPT